MIGVRGSGGIYTGSPPDSGLVGPHHWSHQSWVRRTSRINITAPAYSYRTSHFSLWRWTW